jgi:hypothetical protein
MGALDRFGVILVVVLVIEHPLSQADVARLAVARSVKLRVFAVYRMESSAEHRNSEPIAATHSIGDALLDCKTIMSTALRLAGSLVYHAA